MWSFRFHTRPVSNCQLFSGFFRLKSSDTKVTSPGRSRGDPNKVSPEWPAFEAWRKQALSKLENNKTRGPIYFGDDKPFMHNPDFKVIPPLTEKSRLLIYDQYLQDPSYWTPRKLAVHFKVSLERARAIILLKNRETKMIAKGFQVNEAYVKKMEQYLNATTQQVEIKYNKILTGRKPTFLSVPESFVLTKEQAAEILQKPINKTNEKWADFALLPTEQVETAPLVIREDSTEIGKSQFIFTDISADVPPDQRNIIIRDRNGVLRHANPRERYTEGKRIWGKQSSKFVRASLHAGRMATASKNQLPLKNNQQINQQPFIAPLKNEIHPLSPEK